MIKASRWIWIERLWLGLAWSLRTIRCQLDLDSDWTWDGTNFAFVLIFLPNLPS